MKKILIALLFGMLMLPCIHADVITPTVTKVYFEKDGKPFDKAVEFTANGFGYSFSPGAFEVKEPGTYAPENVFSFSATVSGYGGSIYETYYMNYRHIDYFELEGKTADGNFIIKNISADTIPGECHDAQQADIDPNSNMPVERACELRFNLNDAEWGVVNQVNNTQQANTTNNGNKPVIQPEAKKDFFGGIFCFFAKLFGGSC